MAPAMSMDAQKIAQENAELVLKLQDDFEFLEDWMDRYGYIIDLGNRLDPLDAAEMVDANLVRGCQSQVWLVADAVDDRIIFRADSDAHIVKGLVALVLALFSGRRRTEITELDPAGLFSTLGLDKHLSPNRTNGLFSMVHRIKQLAVLSAA